VKTPACAAGTHYSGVAADGTLQCTADTTTTSLYFGSITTGTNAAALHVGTGGTLDATGGTITANAIAVNTTGTNLVSLNASQLSTGIIPSARLSQTRVVGTSTTSAAGANGGTTVTATATCSSGLLLGGGAQVTSTAGALGKTALLESYPSSATVWTATAVAVQGLGGSNTMT